MGEGPATVRVRHKKTRYYAAIGAATVLAAGVAVGTTVAGANAAPNTAGAVAVPKTSPASSWTITSPTATPIKHVVVIFDENISFDHYFGTYPFAANTDGTAFHAKRGTPKVNGLYTRITPKGPVGPLLTSNPNSFNPTRLTHSQALTCDQNHGYTAEQKAVNNGKMDQFVQNTETGTCTGQPILFGHPGLVMDYYDGNTATGLWNYAQNYAMSDNNWDTTFGPSTPGALNLISGQTGNAFAVDPKTGAKVEDPGSVSPLNSAGIGTVYGDPDPAYDDCSGASHTSTSPLAVATGKTSGTCSAPRNTTWGLVPGQFTRRDQRRRFRSVRRRQQRHHRRHGYRLLAAQAFQYYKSPPAEAPARVRGRHQAHRPGQPLCDLTVHKALTAGNILGGQLTRRKPSGQPCGLPTAR
jgi:phospholipase C